MTINLSGDELIEIIVSLKIRIEQGNKFKSDIEKLLKKDDRENLRHMLAIYNSKIDTLTELTNKIETEMINNGIKNTAESL